MAFDQDEITTGVDFNYTTSAPGQPSLWKYRWQQAEFNTSYISPSILGKVE
jgi:hypothetical protein